MQSVRVAALKGEIDTTSFSTVAQRFGSPLRGPSFGPFLGWAVLWTVYGVGHFPGILSAIFWVGCPYGYCFGMAVL